MSAEDENTSSAEDERPTEDEPPKLRTKPQARNVGRGKLYPDEAAFRADLEAWIGEQATHKVRMQEREKKLKQLREKRRVREPRDRSGRQQPSGAANRKKRAADEKQEFRDIRLREWRTRYNAGRAVRDAAAVKARNAALPPLFVRGEMRRIEEMALLGDMFVDNGQHVRVTASGELNGRVGIVLQRAQLCKEDKDRWQVISWPEADSSGKLMLDASQYHCLLLDCERGELDSDNGDQLHEHTVQLSPYDVQPWPRIGQRIRQTFSDSGNEFDAIGTVTKMYNATSSGELNGTYLCSRVLYASNEQVKCMAGGGVGVDVGSWVQLLEPHPCAFLTPQLFDCTPDEQRWPAGPEWMAQLILATTSNGYDFVKLDSRRERAQRILELRTFGDTEKKRRKNLRDLQVKEAQLAKAQLPYIDRGHLTAAQNASERAVKQREVDRLSTAVRRLKDNFHVRLIEASEEYLPIFDLLVVRAICDDCGCVELEHMWSALPCDFEPISEHDDNCGDDGMLETQFKCAHQHTWRAGKRKALYSHGCHCTCVACENGEMDHVHYISVDLDDEWDD